MKGVGENTGRGVEWEAQRGVRKKVRRHLLENKTDSI